MSSNPHKIWEVVELPPGRAEALARDLGLPIPYAALLLQRGIESRAQAAAFFSATLADLPSPFLMLGMSAAVQVVAEALRRQRPVVVYGDYDVDGATGAAILTLFLKEIGFRQVLACQPLRLEEGYGLHLRALERRLAENSPGGGQAGLLITVDCGISDAVEVARLKERGWSVIVTDHHQPPEKLPEMADAILNPLQPGCPFPDKHLAGVGVAFYLLMGIRSHLAAQGHFLGATVKPNLKEFLDLVAIGTVGDMVPLTGTNRILVRAGLEVLAGSTRPGVRELLRSAGIKGAVVSCEDIGYRLGPRLNAAGRLGDAARAHALLVSSDSQQARRLAEELTGENERRKELIEELCGQAIPMAEAKLGQGRQGLVLVGEKWHAGVIGIGAARIVERFHRPTLVFARQKNGQLKGSGRSVPGLNLHKVLSEVQDIFTQFGGHAAAIGLSLPEERLAELEERFEASLARHLRPELKQARLELAWQGKPEEMGGKEFHNFYERLGPFGMGNPEPVFAVVGRVEEAREVGGKHLKFRMKLNGASYDGIGFGLLDFLSLAEDEERLAVAFRWRKNFFRGEERWELEALDFQKTTI